MTGEQFRLVCSRRSVAEPGKVAIWPSALPSCDTPSISAERASDRCPRLTPQERGRLDRTGLSKVTGEQFRLVLGNLGECAFEGFGDTGVEQWLWRMI